MHFGVCSSGFSLLSARFEAIMKIAGLPKCRIEMRRDIRYGY